MPNKRGTSAKALEARSRKESKKSELKAEKEKEVEDAYWRDDDKQNKKKQDRHAEREQKRVEQLTRKKENEAIYEQEQKEAAAVKLVKNNNVNKISRHQIQTTQNKLAELKQADDSKSIMLVNDKPLEDNVNRCQPDGASARTVAEAIAIFKLSGNDDSTDKNPERRKRAAWLAFYDRRLPELKTEFPSLRLSQLKDKIFKEFQTSPDNPIYQAAVAASDLS